MDSIAFELMWVSKQLKIDGGETNTQILAQSVHIE
jgi:hypothetical protein